MSQLKRGEDERQNQCESGMGSLGIVLAILEHDELRIRQAINRTGESRLLSPVLEDFRRARREIADLQKLLGESWKRGQRDGWRGSD